MSDELAIEFCQECGWNHANIAKCWRKTRREALAKLADPALDPDMRLKLQAAVDEFERYRLETIEFFRAVKP